MNKQEILNYNKRCAEFLGAKVTDLGGAQKAIYYPILGGSHYAHKLKFHSDWNWIMEVVEAIEKIKEVRDVCITTTGCVIFHKEKPFSSHGVYKKEAAIQAINQFLIWYEDFNKE